ncbi:hypothetical protein [Marinitoga aeolica]|uniref:DUF4258 domain-containing protein n=1 Tax=Marinitoga aeolica TaxID=2809031 RepID=A0ABY8PRE5_9BACT|nr:hypothetical protein [Marinitoga aeolica]WGS65195.1 hypothetical protein JRV97_01160 [Marinitoga aeolica]
MIKISENVRRKVSKYGLRENDAFIIMRYGRKAKGKRGATIFYIPKRKIENNKVLEKYRNVYVFAKDNIVIDIFKNANFKIYSK